MHTNDGLLGLIEDAVKGDPRLRSEEVARGMRLGKYLIASQLGAGGMGVVYLAKDTSLGRTVVIKVVKFQSEEEAYRRLTIDRFRREAMAASRVGQHPNVALVYAFDEIDGRHLLVMEYIEGRTLKQELTRSDGKSRALPPRKAAQVAIGILKGLEAIHAAKILHRDLKPGNVMLTHKDDQVKILDFGLGKASEASGEPAFDLTLTTHGVAPGSPLYMSPEQTLGGKVDGRSDVYSVGIMLFRMLVGREPFVRAMPKDLFEAHRHAPIPPIAAPNGATIPDALKAVVRKAMAKTPAERFATAAEMRAALEAVDFTVRPPPIPAKLPPLPRPRGWAYGLLATLAIAAACLGAAPTFGGAYFRDPPAPSPAPVAERRESAPPPEAPEPRKADSGIAIPPPPPPVPTVAQGCEAYKVGRTTEAIASLTAALKADPKDAEGLYCLCGAYVRQPESRDDASKACQAYAAHPERDPAKTRQVDLWLRRLKR
jgi:serine/threonine protein kinase